MKINSLTNFNYYSKSLLSDKQNVNKEQFRINYSDAQSKSQLNNRFYHPLISQVNFKAAETEYRRSPDIDYFKYKSLSPAMKRILRKKCIEFNKDVKSSELSNASKKYLPLMADSDMADFIKVCNIYCKLKDEPILCLGRSPKWFLNTALWMKDGIEDYKFVAFSKNWYRTDKYGLVRMDRYAPTEEEKKAYKRYLKSIQADPQHIVDVHNKTGKKIVITDYINSGKGACSFLDVMSEIAEDDGILEEFANSIRILGIGCLEYTAKRFYDDEEFSIPSVQLPERLMPYNKIIKQEFHDMPLNVFEQMLINENTNECRSSFYPHEAWTAYKPNKFKTGMLSEKKIKDLKGKNPKCVANFTPAMRDYRNLLNFRILDYLDSKNILRENLNSRQWD